MALDLIDGMKMERVKNLPAGTYFKRFHYSKKIYVIGELIHWKYQKTHNKPHYTTATNVNDINDTIDIYNGKMVYIGFDY